ncbi:Crp/Fnr family transcriptional regulator [Bacteroidota bacterium]
MFDDFIYHIKKYGDLDETSISFLQKNVKFKHYKKNELILCAGKVPRYVYFVLDGMVRLFYSFDGEEKTAFFYNKNNFIWPKINSNHLVSTQKNYMSINNSTLVLIDINAIQELNEKSYNFSQIYRNSKEQELIKYQQLISYFVTLSPQERFKNLLEKNKSLFLKVPQQYIASYIGISAETFSRIKKRIYQNKIFV